MTSVFEFVLVSIIGLGMLLGMILFFSKLLDIFFESDDPWKNNDR